MVILGLGSNLGDRLNYLRNALQFIKAIPKLSVEQVSPLYISDPLLPDNAPEKWADLPYLNLAVRCDTTLSPIELLQQLKHIEKKVGRLPEHVWGPRIIDIDILAWDALVLQDDSLTIPHKPLLERPFALFPLADVAPFWVHPVLKKTAVEIAASFGSRFDGLALFHTRQIAQRIDTPQLVGIVNVTPDSFSDGGKFSDPDSAILLTRRLVLAGADVIDIGAEATNPKATRISAETEWDRLAPVLTAILADQSNLLIPPKISVDTRNPDVAKRALALGVDWINDVSGLQQLEMRDVLAENSHDVVIMHHLGIPVDKAVILPLTQNPVDLVLQWAEKRIMEIIQHGIARERIIFDVGIGFGKTAEQCLVLLKHIAQFQQLGVRLLVGHSRKIFIGQFTDKTFAERDVESTVLSLFLAEQNINYLRVHDVEMHARAFKVARAIS
ncbi:MAG: dihydropteroate synthase [Gammaproteobacteria bacterium]